MRSRGAKHPSQQYQRKFHVLIEERELVGISLEKMSAMLAEMAIADGDLYAPVSEAQLREVEEDPLHGMSIAAMMYARFMGCNVSIVGRPGSKGNGFDFQDRDSQRRGWSQMQERGAEGMLKSMISGVSIPTMAQVFGVDQYGANINAHVAFKYITAQEAADILGILLRAQVRRRVDGKKGNDAIRERYAIFKKAKQRRKDAKKFVSEALSEKVEPPNDIAP